MTLPIDEIASRFAAFMNSDSRCDGAINIIAHSMGTAVVRATLPLVSSEKFNRIVFLAPPLRGSPLTRFAPRLACEFFPPLSQLRDVDDSFVSRLPMPRCEQLGIIAARFDLHVPLRSTRVNRAAGDDDGFKDGEGTHYVALPLTHNSLLISPKVARLCDQFIATGKLP